MPTAKKKKTSGRDPTKNFIDKLKCLTVGETKLAEPTHEKFSIKR